MKSRVSGSMLVLNSTRCSPRLNCWKTQLLGFAASVHFRLCGIFFVLFFSGVVFGQNDSLEKSHIHDVVTALAQEVENRYVDEPTGRNMSLSLLKRLKSGVYYSVPQPAFLAQLLEEDLQRIKEDFHLRVYAGLTNLDRYADSSDAWLFYNHDRLENFGLKETRSLAGNIGYIRLDEFTEWLDARDAIAGAISSIQFSDALIVDLRHNTGGAPETMYWLLSYFFEGKSRLEFTGLFFREKNKTEKAFVEKKLEGKRYIEKPLVVLTGPNTASAAEGFAYDIQRLKRGFVLGEKTKGGAQPARTIMLPHGFRVLLPIGKAVDPDNGGNWEGKGVIPDILVDENASLEYAAAVLLDSLSKLTKDTSLVGWYASLAYRQAILSRQYNEPLDSLQRMEGNYEGRKVTFLNGSLFYDNTTKSKQGIATRLLAMPRGGFAFDSKTKDLRQQAKVFPVWEEGEVTSLKIVFESGVEKILLKEEK